MADLPSHVTDATGNAGMAAVPSDLDLTRLEAQARATALKQPVRIFKHVGGRHPSKPGKVIPPSGNYMYRDVRDEEGRDFPAPRFWEAVETVTPALVQ